MPRTRKSYLMNMGRGLLKRMTLKHHKSRSRSPVVAIKGYSPSSRSPAVARGTYVHRRSSIRAPVQYRPYVAHERSTSRNRRARRGVSTNMFKNIVARERQLAKTMKTPLGIGI